MSCFIATSETLQGLILMLNTTRCKISSHRSVLIVLCMLTGYCVEVGDTIPYMSRRSFLGGMKHTNCSSSSTLPYFEADVVIPCIEFPKQNLNCLVKLQDLYFEVCTLYRQPSRSKKKVSWYIWAAIPKQNLNAGEFASGRLPKVCSNEIHSRFNRTFILWCAK